MGAIQPGLKPGLKHASYCESLTDSCEISTKKGLKVIKKWKKKFKI